MRYSFAVLAGAVALLALAGCCGYLSELGNESNATISGQDPVVKITLDGNRSGYAPFWVKYSFWCYDNDGDLVSCTMSLDGQEFAQGDSQDTLFGDNYTAPDFYEQGISTPGAHTLEITGRDAAGHVSSATLDFRVLESLTLTKPGFYTCNNNSRPPCDEYQSAYCGDFTPRDLAVREAAAKAIAKNPGAYSLNQIMDIYDYVKNNVFYQNVPVDLTYQPYAPNETLLTGSGDCKNQAVLIASMIEAIGGSARVLLIPGCEHAYAEVYIGGNESKNRFVDAIFAHYGEAAPNVTWHTSANDSGIWVPLDTAGGSYPGSTIDECFDANQTFAMYDCSLRDYEWNAPDTTWVEYGPTELYNDSDVINPNSWIYFTYSADISRYDYCTYEIGITSKSGPLDWYVIPAGQYNNFKAGYSFSYYGREAQVTAANYTLTMDKPDKFNVIISNAYSNRPITAFTHIVSRCYKK